MRLALFPSTPPFPLDHSAGPRSPSRAFARIFRCLPQREARSHPGIQPGRITERRGRPHLYRPAPSPEVCDACYYRVSSAPATLTLLFREIRAMRRTAAGKSLLTFLMGAYV